jgi:transposase
MDAKVETAKKAPIVRRRFTDEEKRRAVEATFEEGVSMSQVSRRFDLNTNQLFAWRRQYQQGLLKDTGTRLIPVEVVDLIGTKPVKQSTASGNAASTTADSSVEIELAGGHRVRIQGKPDVDIVRLILEALKG